MAASGIVRASHAPCKAVSYFPRPTGLAPFIHSLFCRRFCTSEENLISVHPALGFFALGQLVSCDPNGVPYSQSLRRNPFGEHPLRDPTRQNIEQRTHAVIIARQRMAVAALYDEGAGIKEVTRPFQGVGVRSRSSFIGGSLGLVR
jgi:hypothetical protein